MFDEKFIELSKRRLCKKYFYEFICDIIESNIFDISGVSKHNIVDVCNFYSWKNINPEILQIENVNKKYNICISHLHKINNINSYLNKIYDILEDNGIFFGVFLGNNNAIELSESLYLAYEEMKLPFVNHFLPVVDITSVNNLFKNSGFGEIVASLDGIEIKYGSVYDAFHDIRLHGESNCMENRIKLPIKKSILQMANKIFIEKYGYVKYNFLFIFAKKSSASNRLQVKL